MAPPPPGHWLHSCEVWATPPGWNTTATVANKVAAANTERGLMSRPSPSSARGPNLLLSGFCSPLIDHVRSSSPRKNIYQDWQDDKHQNGSEQNTANDDQSKRALNLCTDSR